MSFLRTRNFRHYAFGLACTFFGAWMMAMTGSMLPLALGAAISIMSTVPLVRAIWARKPEPGNPSP